VEARAAASFALSERPVPTRPLSVQLRTLRQVAARLQATVRQRTRLVNQFHHLLALTFPELGLLVKDVALGRVLELVHRYSTAPLLPAAADQDLAAIPYFPDRHVARLRELARSSVASLAGPAAEEMVCNQVRQLRDTSARHKRLENLVVQAYHGLARTNHLATITGIGDVAAAVLTAAVADIDRVDTPGKLVASFGALPIGMSSGVDPDGQPRGSRRYVMSKRGNDLMRRYLGMAALSAVRCHPAMRALYRRVVAKHPEHKAIAIGHAMRKLLHLVFALWKSDQPFDPKHHSWEGTAPRSDEEGDVGDRPADQADAAKNQTSGHKPETTPVRTVVTAVRATTVPPAPSVGESTFLDFAHLKRQLPMARVLDHLGLSSRLRGSCPQRRGPCPIHRGDGRGRTFSVNPDENVFHCFDARCGKQGDVIDLWTALHHLSPRGRP
jgi:transposase